MPVSGAPVVLVDDGTPITPTNDYGTPVTIVGGTTITTVSDGEALQVPVTGTYTDTATVSVENGAVTGIVLS